VGWNGLFSDAFTVKVEVLFGLFCIIIRLFGVFMVIGFEFCCK